MTHAAPAWAHVVINSCLFPPMVDQGWAACHNCLAHLWSPPLEMEEFWQLSVELFQPSPSFFLFQEKRKREKVRHGCPTQFLDWQPCLLLQRCAIIDHTFERRRQTIRSRARNSLWSNPPSGVSSLSFLSLWKRKRKGEKNPQHLSSYEREENHFHMKRCLRMKFL